MPSLEPDGEYKMKKRIALLTPFLVIFVCDIAQAGFSWKKFGRAAVAVGTVGGSEVVRAIDEERIRERREAAAAAKREEAARQQQIRRNQELKSEADKLAIQLQSNAEAIQNLRLENTGDEAELATLTQLIKTSTEMNSKTKALVLHQDRLQPILIQLREILETSNGNPQNIEAWTISLEALQAELQGPEADLVKSLLSDLQTMRDQDRKNLQEVAPLLLEALRVDDMNVWSPLISSTSQIETSFRTRHQILSEDVSVRKQRITALQQENQAFKKQKQHYLSQIQ